MTLDYKTCKQLKESGFPQMGDGFALVLNEKLPESEETMSVIPWCSYVFNPVRDDKEALYCPTLAELIDACGEDFMFVQRANDEVGYYTEEERWWAAHAPTGLRHVDLEDMDGELGKTPEEAVANLYLALKDETK